MSGEQMKTTKLYCLWNKNLISEEQNSSAWGKIHDFKGNKKISICGTNKTTRETNN
jgi:hypothetical protein